MPVISEEYRALNRQLHTDRSSYGTGLSSKRHYGTIANFAKSLNPASILDYGCGKGALGKALSHLMVIGYDPSIPGLDDLPEPADFVVSTDVLEHIEPELLDSVLDDIARCTRKAVFLTVNMMPAEAKLADGRNAHLIQKPVEWWLPKLMARWDLRAVNVVPGEFAFFGLAKEEKQSGRIAA